MTEIKAPNRHLLLDQHNREWIVNEELQNIPVLEPNKEPLLIWGPTDNLDVPDETLLVPLTLDLPPEVHQLQLLLLAEDEVVRGNDHQVAVHDLSDVALKLVPHGVLAFLLRLDVNKYLVVKLNRQTIPIDRDLLDQLPALQPDLLITQHVLDDDIR